MLTKLKDRDGAFASSFLFLLKLKALPIRAKNKPGCMINSLRNRIAHHEPICFGAGNTIDTTYARAHYKEMTDILGCMNIDSVELFAGHTDVLEEANYIDSI